MSKKLQARQDSWWAHEPDRTRITELSTQYASLKREERIEGWRRNLLVVGSIAAAVALLSALSAFLLH